MKNLSKIIILLTVIIMFLQCFILTQNSFAKEKNETPVNPDLLIPESVKREREEEERKRIEEETHNYNIISEEDKVKFRKFVEIKEEYQGFVAIGGITLIIALIMSS